MSNKNQVESLLVSKEELLNGVSIPDINEEMSLFVSPDRLEAFVVYHGEAISLELNNKIQAFLRATPIDFGILEKPEKRDNVFILAKGRPPVKGKDAKVIFKKPKYLENLNEINQLIRENKFICYEQNELVAEKSEPTNGISGVDVFSEEITAPKGKWITFPVGKGVQITEDNKFLKAVCHGKLEIIEGKINILDVVKYEGGINHTTGNLIFNGKLLEITESVEHGFILEVNGDLIVNKSIENAIVNVTGNATVKGLIIGENSKVSVKGNLTCNIIENANVIVDGDLIVKNYIIDADCLSMGNIVVTEKKGLILGGKTVSFKTIKANEIGSDLNTPTIIFVGLMDEYSKKLLELRKEYSENYSKLNDVKKGLFKLVEIEKKQELCGKTKGIKDNLVRAEKKLSEKLDEIFKQMDKLQKFIDDAPDPRVTVLRKAHPGVIININDQQLVLKDIFINKLFRLTDDKIIADDATKY